jgi:hypothetical protein
MVSLAILAVQFDRDLSFFLRGLTLARAVGERQVVL